MNQPEMIALFSGDLPTLPQVATRILESVQNPKATARQLSTIIANDPAMVGKLLRIANSAMYGCREPVAGVRRAIVVLGFNTLRSVVMAAATKSMYHSQESNFKDFLLWEHSLAVAIGARLLASETGYLAQEEAFVAGLIHDVGKIVLDRKLGQEYHPVIERVFNEGETFVEAETEILGFDHAQIGALVVKKWNLPPQLEEAVRLHHRPAEAEIEPRLTALVSLANSLAVKLEIGPERDHKLALDRLDAIRMLSVDPATVRETMDRIQETLEEEKKLFEASQAT